MVLVRVATLLTPLARTFVRRVLGSPNKSLTLGVDCVTELLDHRLFDVLLAVLVWVTQLSTP